MSFLDNYEPVEDRLRRFWDDHPEGRVLTSIEHGDGWFIVRSEVYTDRDDTRPAATGYAHEVVTQRGVNATSALENCETSSVGRALANLNYAPKGARPSREEMTKAQRRDDGWSDELYAANAALVDEMDGLNPLRTLYVEAEKRGDTAVMGAAKVRAEQVKA